MKKDDTQEHLLGRWLAGDLSEAELKEFEAREDFEDLKQIAEGSAALEAPPFDEAASWDRLNSMVELNDQESASKPNPAFKRFRLFIGGIAAGLLVWAVVWLAFPGEDLQVYQTLSQEQKSIELPDGSQVTLNAGSSLRFAGRDFESDRQLELEGEAFFEVAKGKRFAVNTKAGKVEVLGTSFNVHARENGLNVGCFTGKVRVSDANFTTLLEPGQGISLVPQEAPKSYQLSQSSPSWPQGTFEFVQAPFSEVAAELERQFGLALTHSGMNNKKFTGSFSRDDLGQALKSLALPYGYEWKKLSEKEYKLSPAE